MLEVNIKKKLRSFDLDVQFKADNNALALLGSSGSGKSMTLKCIAGVEKPDSGRIILDGEVLFDSSQGICLPPQKRRIGLLFQNFALFPMMTVMQNILAGCNQLPRKVRKQHAQSLISKFGLDGLEKAYPSKLSGGQQQRVALARMIAANPRLLLFDEPFSALDTHLRRQLGQMVADVLETYDASAILVSHDCAEAYRLCPNIAIMENGKITVNKDRASLFKDPETITGAKLIGCENILPVRVQDRSVLISALGISIDKAKTDNIECVGIPATVIHPDSSGEYIFSAKVEKITYSPYDITLDVCMSHSNQQIACRIPLDKQIPQINDEMTFSFDKKDIFFLRNS